MNMVTLSPDVESPADEQPKHQWDTFAKCCCCGKKVCAEALAETTASAKEFDQAAAALSRKEWWT